MHRRFNAPFAFCLSSLFGSFVDNFADFFHWQNTVHYQPLRNYRFEFVIGQTDSVRCRMHVTGDHQICNFAGTGKCHAIEQPAIFSHDLNPSLTLTSFSSDGIAATEIIAGLLAYSNNVNVFALLRVHKVHGSPKDVGVKCTRQTLLARNNNDGDVIFRTAYQHWVTQLAGLWIVSLSARDQRFEHVREHLRIGSCSNCSLLRAAQLGRRDHLHGLGDLPRVSHAADAPPNIKKVCHDYLNSQEFLPLTFNYQLTKFPDYQLDGGISHIHCDKFRITPLPCLKQQVDAPPRIAA